MNRPHEVDSKVPQLRPQLRPQLPNPEIGNFKLRLQVAGVEAKLRHELRSSWRSLKHPIESAAACNGHAISIKKIVNNYVPSFLDNL